MEAITGKEKLRDIMMWKSMTSVVLPYTLIQHVGHENYG
jgi:hypothetical protein